MTLRPEWREQYARDGYFVAPGVLEADDIEKIRGHIEGVLARADEDAGGPRLDPEPEVRDGGGADWTLRDRYRKIGQLGLYHAGFWNNWHCHPNVLALVRPFLGEQIRLMFSSVFLKPARHGAATPWHQDLGLWGQKVTGAVSIWCALDPATRENGCLQIIPGSHRLGEVEHALYPGAVHKEIRRDLLESREPIAIELAAGDGVVWHAAMFHSSPPNPSDRNRIGVAGVYVSDAMVQALGPENRLLFPWVVQDGAVLRRPACEDGRDPPTAGGRHGPISSLNLLDGIDDRVCIDVDRTGSG